MPEGDGAWDDYGVWFCLPPGILELWEKWLTNLWGEAYMHRLLLKMLTCLAPALHIVANPKTSCKGKACSLGAGLALPFSSLLLFLLFCTLSLDSSSSRSLNISSLSRSRSFWVHTDS